MLRKCAEVFFNKKNVHTNLIKQNYLSIPFADIVKERTL